MSWKEMVVALSLTVCLCGTILGCTYIIHQHSDHEIKQEGYSIGYKDAQEDKRRLVERSRLERMFNR